MKFTSIAVVAALCASAEAIRFTDDLAKSLAQDLEAATNEEPAAPEPALAQKKAVSKKAVSSKKASKAKATVSKKAAVKKEEDTSDIPMDAAAIKAYSSVIADAAEDSEPAKPVIYTKTMPDEPKEEHHTETLDFDPMGSMIQNEIVSIKDASIKAAADNSA